MAWDWVDKVPDRKWGGGVYALYQNGQLVYIGRTGNFRSRLQTHQRRFGFDLAKLKCIETTREQMEVERRLINRLLPVLNRQIPRKLTEAWWYRGRVR